MSARLLTLVIVVLSAVACGPLFPTVGSSPDASGRSPKGPLMAAFDQSLATWQAAGITRYAFTYTARCFCPMTPHLIVRDGDEIRIDGQVMNGSVAPPIGAPLGVEGLFDQVRRAIQGDAATIVYDPTTGVPISMDSDPILNAVDDELTFEVTDWTLEPPDDRGLGAITDARRRWEGRPVQAYTLTLSFTCRCVHDGKRYAITVGGGEPVVRSGGRQVNLNDLEGVPLSVEALFDWASASASTGDAVAEFDPTTGAPTRLRADSAKDASGEPETIEASLEIIGSGALSSATP